MKLTYLILLLTLTSILNADTTSVNKKTCLSIAKKIKIQNSKLRAGYSLKQGEKLKHKLRLLKKQQYACRMKRYPTQ